MLPPVLPPSNFSWTTKASEIAASTQLPTALRELISDYTKDFLLEAEQPLSFDETGKVTNESVRAAIVAVLSLSDPDYGRIKKAVLDNLGKASDENKSHYEKALQEIFDQVRLECNGIIHMESVAFEDLNLNNFNLTGMNATGSLFDQVTFNSVNLTNADLTDCDFDSCELDDVNLHNANLTDIRVAYGVFWKVNMENARAIDADFESCWMSDVDVAGMIVNDPQFAKRSVLTRVMIENQEYETPMLGEGEASKDGEGEVLTSGSRPPREGAAITLPARQPVLKCSPKPENKHIGVKRPREDE